MKGKKSLSIFLIALMAFGMFLVSVPFASGADGAGFPPITVDGDVTDWSALQPLNLPTGYQVTPLESTGDTEAWSSDITKVSQGSTGVSDPLMVAKNDKARDLAALYAWFDDNGDMFFRIDVAELYAGWNAGNASLYHIYIDTDDDNTTGGTAGLNACDIAVNGWEIMIYYDGINGFVVDNSLTVLADTGGTGGMAAAFAIGAPGSIEIGIDRTQVGLDDINLTSTMVFSFKPGEPGYVFDPDAPGTNGIGVGAGDQADELPDGVTNLPTVPTKTLGGKDLRLDMSVGARVELMDSVTGDENLTSSGWAVDNTFTLNVTIYDAVDLAGYTLGATWDPALLQCLSVVYVKDWFSSMIEIGGTINNTLGEINPGYSGAATAGGYYGTGTVLQFRFKVLQAYPGNSTWIEIIADGLADSALNDMVFVFKNALWGVPPPVPTPPTASFTETPSPYYANVTQIVFTDTSVAGDDGWVPVAITNWFWDFGDGTNSTDQNPTHIYNVSNALLPIVFTVNLTITDALGRKDSATADKTILEVQFGPVIDLYTEIERAYGYSAYNTGEGAHQNADAYQIDENVTLYANVTYNGWPLQDRLVVFEAWDGKGNNVLLRTVLTDENGVATTTFRIRTVCGDREDAWGKWFVIAKTSVAKGPINDTMWFDCGDYIDLISVETEIAWPIDAHMNFTITLINIAQAPRNVTIVITVYDDLEVPIGKIYLNTTISAGVFCDPYEEVIFMECLYIPKWAYVGENAMVYVSALTDWPMNCGVPYCEEVAQGFTIEIP